MVKPGFLELFLRLFPKIFLVILFLNSFLNNIFFWKTKKKKRKEKKQEQIMIKATYLMSFFPLAKKAATQQLINVISHFIICHKQAFKLYSSIQPIPAPHQKPSVSVLSQQRNSILDHPKLSLKLIRNMSRKL